MPDRPAQDAAPPSRAAPGGLAKETLSSGRAATSKVDRSICACCGQRFRPRRDGGRAQRFCKPACRRALDAAARAWVAAALASGMLAVNALRSGPATTRALPPEAVSRPPLDEPGKPAPAPAEPFENPAARSPGARSDAEQLLTGIVLALGELDDDAFVAELKLLGPRLVRRLFEWHDAAAR